MHRYFCHNHHHNNYICLIPWVCILFSSSFSHFFFFFSFACYTGLGREEITTIHLLELELGWGLFFLSFFFFYSCLFSLFFVSFFFLIHSIHTLRAYYTPCALFTFISLSNQGVCNGRGDSVGEERETFVCLAG